MAKIKIRPRPGALSELLKTKSMTQMDAFQKTRVDRKTLSKIDRGEEVKLETLQQVANKLQVPEEYFRNPPTDEVTDNSDDWHLGNIMLRKLDAPRLEEFLGGAERIKWHLNASVRDSEARKFLEDFETAAENFRKQSFLIALETETQSLRLQLDRLKTADDLADRLARLSEYRLTLLGTEQNFWECSIEEHGNSDVTWLVEKYRSSKTVYLSVDPFGTQSRRVRGSYGNPPPFLAPDPDTIVFVDGERLPSAEEL